MYIILPDDSESVSPKYNNAFAAFPEMIETTASVTDEALLWNEAIVCADVVNPFPLAITCNFELGVVVPIPILPLLARKRLEVAVIVFVPEKYGN